LKTSQEEKLQQLIAFDKEHQQKGCYLIGIDEAGRGPLCGPVVAAAVIIPGLDDNILESLKYLNDSKKFSGNITRREELYDYLTHSKCYYAVANGSLEEIEEHNIYQTTYLTMHKAYNDVVKQIKNKKHKVLVDGTRTIKHIPEEIPQEAVVKGDGKSACIAAASIIAKVYRDRIMRQLAKEFPEYKWEKNNGYGTKEHIEAIRLHGRCKYHRKSFKIKGLDIIDSTKK
jgi:ribonuclease HII